MTKPSLQTVALGVEKYQVDRNWAQLPNGSGQVSDVTGDERGHIFVLLRYDRATGASGPAVVELEPGGRTVAAWGNDQIFDGHMMTFASNGSIYVVDRDAHQIVVFSREGEVKLRLGTRHAPLDPFNHPTDVFVDPAGDIFVSDGYAASSVHRFAPDGRYLGMWGHHGRNSSAMMAPHALWGLSDGRMAVVDRDSNRVLLYTPDGKPLGEIGTFLRPTAIWGDRRDRLYVADSTPSLTLLTDRGDVLGRCRPALNGAHGIWGTPNGDIYLAEGNPSRVTRLAKS